MDAKFFSGELSMKLVFDGKNQIKLTSIEEPAASSASDWTWGDEELAVTAADDDPQVSDLRQVMRAADSKRAPLALSVEPLFRCVGDLVFSIKHFLGLERVGDNVVEARKKLLLHLATSALAVLVVAVAIFDSKAIDQKKVTVTVLKETTASSNQNAKDITEKARGVDARQSVMVVSSNIPSQSPPSFTGRYNGQFMSVRRAR